MANSELICVIWLDLEVFFCYHDRSPKFHRGIGGRVKRLYTWYLAVKEWREEKVYDFLAWHDRMSTRIFGRDYNLAAFVEVFVFVVLLTGLAAIAFRYLYIA
jgi:hypothetical protein